MVQFRIDESNGKRSLNLGDVSVNVRTILQPGDPVPDLEVASTNGKKMKLEDFRGKVVLLDFWASWCGSCVAKMPELKAVYKDFGGRGDFEIIGLSLDRSIETAKRFAERQELKWVQGFLGEWTSTEIPERYGVSAIPALYLIGRDGRLIAKGFELRPIREELERVLATEKESL